MFFLGSPHADRPTALGLALFTGYQPSWRVCALAACVGRCGGGRDQARSSERVVDRMSNCRFTAVFVKMTKDLHRKVFPGFSTFGERIWQLERTFRHQRETNANEPFPRTRYSPCNGDRDSWRGSVRNTDRGRFGGIIEAVVCAACSKDCVPEIMGPRHELMGSGCTVVPLLCELTH